MTIASEIQRIQTNIANAYDALEAKGATMPATENTDNLVTTIDTISGGGGDTITAGNNTDLAILSGDKVWVNKEAYYERNFTVVGNPIINNSTGVVSEFSTSNYLQLQNAFNPGSNTWEMLFKVRTGSDVSTNQKIIHFSKGTDLNGRYGIGVNINQSKFEFFCSSDGTSWLFDSSGTYTPLSNTLYWVKVSFNGSAYKLQYSLDGETFVDDIIYNSSLTVYDSLPYCRIGIYQSTNLQDPWLGSIYLAETYINVNSIRWWTPTFTKLSDYTINNFNSGITNYTVVGNPTFYKGFAAGFSVNDYLTIPNSLAAIGNIFYYHFKTGSTPSSTIRLYTLETFDALLETSSNDLLVYSWSARQFTTLMNVSNNTEYWIRVKTSTGQRSYAISTDGTTYGAETVITDTTYGPQPSGTFYLGGYASASEYWNGFLYLNDCYITDSNGVEIWRAYEPNLTENTLMGYAQENIASGSTGDVLTLIQPKYYAYKDLLNRYVYCKNLITSTDFYYDLNARSDNGKATSISELTVPTRAKPVSVTSTSVTFNVMPYYRTEQDDLY